MELRQAVTDRELIKAYRSGDRHAFDFLMLRYQVRIERLVSHYVVNSSDINDITQDVFIKIFRSLKDFRGDSAFYTWIYRIAVNTAKNYVISQKRQPVTEALDQLAPQEMERYLPLADEGSPEANVLCDELRASLNQAIGDLPVDLRVAISLRELSGLAYDEIAKEMNCPVGTVRSRIFRAREAIDRRVRQWSYMI